MLAYIKYVLHFGISLNVTYLGYRLFDMEHILWKIQKKKKVVLAELRLNFRDHTIAIEYSRALATVMMLTLWSCDKDCELNYMS